MSDFRIFLLFIIILTAIFFATTPSFSHSWYEHECCDVQDCAPISGVKEDGTPWSEVEEVENGWVWKSHRGSFFFHANDDRVRPSRDSFYHGCITVGEHGRDYYPRCLYVPMMF